MENYISISLLKYYFQIASDNIINAQANNDVQLLNDTLVWLDLTLSEYIVASEGILKITYDNDYLASKNNPIEYRTVYYVLFSLQDIFKGVTLLFLDLYYQFLVKDGVLI